MKTITPAHRTRLKLARTYIDHHYDQPLTLDHLSREAGFSPYHFIRLFHAAYRKTPHQYLIARRLDQAKELLSASDLPIQDICVEVGFESLGSFSTLFRREVGLSPAAYRRSKQRRTQPDYMPLCHRFMHGLDDEI